MVKFSNVISKLLFLLSVPAILLAQSLASIDVNTADITGTISPGTVTLRYEKMASRRYSADARTVEQRPSLCKCSCPGNLVPNLKAFDTEFSVISGAE